MEENEITGFEMNDRVGLVMRNAHRNFEHCRPIGEQVRHWLVTIQSDDDRGTNKQMINNKNER